MVQLIAGNVVLKPSQKRRIHAHLRRCIQLGSRLGEFKLVIWINRVGKSIQARARLIDPAGRFECRSKEQGIVQAVDELIGSILSRVHRLNVMPG
jgi:hypothetical protein